jgi:hypothetical protein
MIAKHWKKQLGREERRRSARTSDLLNAIQEVPKVNFLGKHALLAATAFLVFDVL